MSDFTDSDRDSDRDSDMESDFTSEPEDGSDNGSNSEGMIDWSSDDDSDEETNIMLSREEKAKIAIEEALTPFDDTFGKDTDLRQFSKGTFFFFFFRYSEFMQGNPETYACVSEWRDS